MKYVYLIALVGAWFTLRVFKAQKSGLSNSIKASLVLKKFVVNSDQETYLEISGRHPGLISWIFNKMKFDITTTVIGNSQGIVFKNSSLFGQKYNVVSLHQISSVHCGFGRPIGYIVMAGFLLLAGVVYSVQGVWDYISYTAIHDFSLGFTMEVSKHIVTKGLLIYVVALIFIIAYFLLKNIIINYETTGGMILGVTFRRSVIENVAVDIAKAKEAVDVVNRKVLELREI